MTLLPVRTSVKCPPAYRWFSSTSRSQGPMAFVAPAVSATSQLGSTEPSERLIIAMLVLFTPSLSWEKCPPTITLSGPSIVAVCTSPPVLYSHTTEPVFPLSRRKDLRKLGPRNPLVMRSQVTARSDATSSWFWKLVVGMAHGCSEPLLASKRAINWRVLKTPSEPAALRNFPPANTVGCVSEGQEKAR